MRRKELKRRIEIVLVCFAIQLTWIAPIGIKVCMDKAQVVENTQIESTVESTVVPETEEVFVEESTSDIVFMPEETETENEVDIDTEVETEVSTEVEFVSVSFIPIEIQKLCFEIGEEYNIAPELLIAIIERESGGKVNALNKKSGCMGLMQLHPKYADYYLTKAGASDPFDAEDNIRAGCEILIEKFEKYYDLPYVLMKYHGESDAKKKFKSGNYSKYCKEIMKRMEEMQELQEGENGN